MASAKAESFPSVSSESFEKEKNWIVNSDNVPKTKEKDFKQTVKSFLLRC